MVLSYVGIETSVGQTVEVPIIVRSLAESFALLDEEMLPIGIDHGLIMTLDRDLKEQNYVCQAVDHYECAWWESRKPRDLSLVEVLDRSTLENCLESHLRQIEKPPSIQVSTTQPPSFPTTSENPTNCPKCKEYSQLLSDTLLDMLGLHNLAKSWKSSAENQSYLDLRRASTFYLLHEAAVIKESAGARSATSKSSNPSSIRENAKRELDRLRALPPSSYKWTWGEH